MAPAQGGTDQPPLPGASPLLLLLLLSAAAVVTLIEHVSLQSHAGFDLLFVVWWLNGRAESSRG
jgi:hypothetical protein